MINAKNLPYNKTVIEYIKKRKDKGDKIILATASHELYATNIFNYLKTEKISTTINEKNNLFDDVMASNKNFNLSSKNKAAKLIERFGKKKFDYMGDHLRDIPVWEAANLSILVNPSNKIIKKTKHLNTITLSSKNIWT
jgi:phosphoserine phosphatase